MTISGSNNVPESFTICRKAVFGDIFEPDKHPETSESKVSTTARILAPRGIRAILVAPGAIETDFTKPAFDRDPHAIKMIASQTALGRVGIPDDIGDAVAFLCSEDARWVNGQRLEASAGAFL